MKVAILAPVAWRTPPREYGPWEQVASNLAEGLVKKGVDLTLFATADSITSGKLDAVCELGYEEDKDCNPKVLESLHISNVMEKSGDFDIIHNHFDFLPLVFAGLIKTPMVTTIHGFSSPSIVPVYRKYNRIAHYVSISYADRRKDLTYIANVYNGIKVEDFLFQDNPDNYLLFFGRIHHDKGTHEAIQIAKQAKKKLIISGLIQDRVYYEEKIEPEIDQESILYVGNSGPVERNELLGGALALLHPINFDEPFGLSVAEAMMCGTPVIAFDRGSMKELIKPGQTGFVTQNVGEAVEALGDIQMISRSACRNWAISQFSQDKMVEDYLSVYEQILAKRSESFLLSHSKER